MRPIVRKSRGLSQGEGESYGGHVWAGKTWKESTTSEIVILLKEDRVTTERCVTIKTLKHIAKTGRTPYLLSIARALGGKDDSVPQSLSGLIPVGHSITRGNKNQF